MWEGTAGGLWPNLFILPALGSDQVAWEFSELGLGNPQSFWASCISAELPSSQWEHFVSYPV